MKILMQDGVSLNVLHLPMNDARWELYWFLLLTCNGTFIVVVLWSIRIIAPPLEEEATLLSQNDLSHKDEQLITILCDANVPPSKIFKVMNAVREDDKGTLLPKTIFNINEKCRRLIDLANRILPTCTDAEKTLKLLELWVLFSFYHWTLI